MDWLEAQVITAHAASASSTAMATQPLAAATAVIRPVLHNVPADAHVALPMQIRLFLSLPTEIKLNIYKHFWARTTSDLSRINSSPLGITKLDTANTIDLTPMGVPQRKLLCFDNGMTYLQPAVRNDFYDVLLDNLLPIRVTFDDRVAYKADMINGGLLNEIQPGIFIREVLSSSLIGQDLVTRAKRLEVYVNMWRPASSKGIGYGLCDPGLEQLPFIDELDKWLGNLKSPGQIILVVQSRLKFRDGYRLGINWDWLLSQLVPLKRKYAALKIIAFDDKINFPSDGGYHYTCKNPATGAWSTLVQMGENGVSNAQRQANFQTAGVRLR